MEEFTLAPQPALPYSAYCLSLPLISVCTGCGSVSAANLQLPQHVMDKFRNLALIECIPVYRLLANGPIRQPLARLPCGYARERFRCWRRGRAPQFHVARLRLAKQQDAGPRLWAERQASKPRCFASRLGCLDRESR